MKPKKYKKIKLAFGGKAMNIDTPQEILQKMQLDTQQAKAEAMQNSQGLRMAASVLGSMGSSMMQKGYAGMGKQEGMTGFMQRNVGDITSALNMMQGLNFAFGGDVPNVPVEIEGEEVGEMPDGSVFEAKGPSHEQGGIDITLPAGTEMFSKRIKIDGVSMADRKKSRKKKEVSLEKMVEDNMYDLLTKNSLNRTKAVNKKEEEADKKIQDFVGGIMQNNPQEHKYGRTVHGDIVTDSPGSIGKPNKAGSSFFDGLFDNIDLGEFSGISIGDAIGLAGNLYSAFEPMNNTLRNRAGDTPNINAFEDYGEDGLNTIQRTKDYVESQQAHALDDLQLSRNALVSRNRNSARGVNTMRALDLASNAQMNKGERDIYDSYTQQMMQILGQEAGMENQQDRIVMEGEQKRDLADRMDRDDYYSQLAQDIATKGAGIQALGKDINQLKSNKENLDIIDKLKNLGFTDNQIKEYMDMIIKSRGIVSSKQAKPKKSKK